jgi:hypothetical protein
MGAQSIDPSVSHAVGELLLLPPRHGGRERVRERLAESRPAGEPWSYRFFIELEGAADSSSVREAMAAAREGATVRVLGSYPRWTA